MTNKGKQKPLISDHQGSKLRYFLTIVHKVSSYESNAIITIIDIK
jgi:hypothetical protein